MTVQTESPEALESTHAARLPRRRSWPLALVGAAATVVASLVFALVVIQSDERVAVTVAARDLAVGEFLDEADLTEVRLGMEAGLPMVTPEEARSLVGQPASVPILAGTVITPDMFGSAVVPESGRVQATVAFEAGAYPLGVQPGAAVVVLLPLEQGSEDSSEAATGGLVRIQAVVAAVDGESPALITLDLGESDAQYLALADRSSAVLVLAAADSGGE